MLEVSDGYRALVSSAGSWTPEDSAHFEIAGPDAHALVNRLVTADIAALEPGQFIHSLLLHDDASILDRVTVYRFPERIMLTLDGAQRADVWNHLVRRKRGNLRMRDISADTGFVMVRGPHTFARLAPLLSPPLPGPCEIQPARFAGIDVFAGRSGDEGPDGADLFCRTRDLPALQQALSRAGVVAASLPDWQLLRIEWGIPVPGTDIDPGDTPVEAGLEHLVAEGKGAPFPGETALAARRQTGAIKRLVGFHLMGEDMPPPAARVSVANVMVDRVRSIVHSPRVGIIGTTAIPTTADTPGTPLIINAGNRSWEGRVVRRPFVSRTLT